MKTVALGEITKINPRLGRTMASDEPVSFVPMAYLSDQSAAATPESVRPFGEVSKGYTPMLDGDLLVAKITPCFENGKIGQAQLTTRVGMGSTEFHVVRPSAEIDARYLLHFLRTPRVNQAGRLRMTGSGGQRRVPAAYLEELGVPLPPIDEQRRIATILDRAAELVRLTAQATAFEGALLRAALMRVIANLDDRRAPLSSEADIVSGITKGRKLSSEAQTQEVPYLAVSNVQAGHLNLTSVKTIAVTPAELERYRLQRDDLLLTEGGDPDKLGRGTLWREELPLSLHQNHVFRVRLKRAASLRPAMLAAWVASSESRRYFLRSAKQTTGIASINKAQLGELPVPVMDGATQARFESELKGIERAVEPLRQRQAVVHALFATLQSRAFSGEL